MRPIRLSILAAAAALAAAVSTGAGASTTPSLQPLCTVGPIRCQVALRTDIPIVAEAAEAHDGLGPADLRAAYKLAQAAATRGAARPSRSWTPTTIRQSRPI